MFSDNHVGHWKSVMGVEVGQFYRPEIFPHTTEAVFIALCAETILVRWGVGGRRETEKERERASATQS